MTLTARQLAIAIKAKDPERYKKILAASGSASKNKSPSVKLDTHPHLLGIIDKVCERLGLTTADIVSTRRHKTITLARELIVALARQLTICSYPEITTAIRGRGISHCGAIEALQRFNRTIDQPTAIGKTKLELFDELSKEISHEPSSDNGEVQSG